MHSGKSNNSSRIRDLFMYFFPSQWQYNLQCRMIQYTYLLVNQMQNVIWYSNRDHTKNPSIYWSLKDSGFGRLNLDWLDLSSVRRTFHLRIHADIDWEKPFNFDSTRTLQTAWSNDLAFYDRHQISRLTKFNSVKLAQTPHEQQSG